MQFATASQKKDGCRRIVKLFLMSDSQKYDARLHIASFFVLSKIIKEPLILGFAGRDKDVRGRQIFNFHRTPEEEDVQDGDENVRGRQFLRFLYNVR